MKTGYWDQTQGQYIRTVCQNQTLKQNTGTEHQDWTPEPDIRTACQNQTTELETSTASQNQNQAIKTKH